jgi:hypothetical protein
MNIKINKEENDLLSLFEYKEYLFGSRLLGNYTEESDFDYLRIIEDENIHSLVNTKAVYLPNIHCFQYTESKDKQILWMTKSQFWKNFFSGDGSLLTDIILFSGKFDNVLELCYSYKIIKGLLGVTKRDLKKHKDWKKRILYSKKSLFMAEKLLNKELPTLEEIQNILSNYSDIDIPSLQEKENNLRVKLNEKLNNNEIYFYPEFNETNKLANLLAKSNNIKEFKYD